MLDESDSVAIVLCDYPGEARLQHRRGVLRLLRLHSAQQVKYLRKQLLQGNEFNLVLAAASLERAALLEDLVDAAYLQAMAVDAAPPYAQNDFLQMLERGRADVITRANELESMLLGSLRVLADIRRLLAALQAGAWPDARRDIDAQLQRLLAAGFMRDTPAPWLDQLPRYLKAVRTRIERLPGQYPKDQSHTAAAAGTGGAAVGGRRQAARLAVAQRGGRPLPLAAGGVPGFPLRPEPGNPPGGIRQAPAGAVAGGGTVVGQKPALNMWLKPAGRAGGIGCNFHRGMVSQLPRSLLTGSTSAGTLRAITSSTQSTER